MRSSFSSKDVSRPELLAKSCCRFIMNTLYYWLSGLAVYSPLLSVVLPVQRGRMWLERIFDETIFPRTEQTGKEIGGN